MAKGIYISPLPVLKFSLQAFVVIRPFFCAVKHKMRNGMCKDCTALVKLLSWWIQNVWSKLVPLFPLINYKADQAVRKLMQMPVTVVEMCLKGPGSRKLYVLESISGVNGESWLQLLRNVCQNHHLRQEYQKKCCKICVIWLLPSLIGF